MSAATTTAWRRIGIAGVIALVAAAYAPLLPWLTERYGAADGYFSHGPLVPLASAWLLWRDRRELAARVGAGSWKGLFLVIPTLLALLLATHVRLDSPALATLLLLIPGLVWLLSGARVLRRAAFPLAFLAFAVPWPMFAVASGVQALKELVLRGSSTLVNLFGAGVTAQGSYLLLPGGERLLIDDPCSGLRSLLALVALGAFMAGSARDLTRGQRGLLFALSLPVAIAANVLRVALLAAIGCGWGAARAGAWHDPSTWAIYIVALLLYVACERKLRDAGERSRKKAPPSATTHDAGTGAAVRAEVPL